MASARRVRSARRSAWPERLRTGLWLATVAGLSATTSWVRAEDPQAAAVAGHPAPGPGDTPPPAAATPASLISAQAEQHSPAFALTVNPLALIFGQARLEFEFRPSNWGSNDLEVFYQPEGLLAGPEHNAAGLSFGMRIYYTLHWRAHRGPLGWHRYVGLRYLGSGPRGLCIG
jgi:hypothetical protein